MTSAGSTSHLGAYGLVIKGLSGAEDLLVPQDPAAPTLEVSQELATASRASDLAYLDDGRYETPLVDGGWLHLTRNGRARYRLPAVLSSDDLLHPYCAPAAAQLNLWEGRNVLHGGVLLFGDAAVAVVGERESGKSSLVAAASTVGVDVLSDDLVVVDAIGEEVFTGPRSVDLRPGTAAELGITGTRLVRGDSRDRLVLPAAPSSARLAAVVLLEWHQGDIKIDPVSVPGRLPALLPHTAVGPGAGGMRLALELAHVPLLVLRRPRGWSLMPAILSTIRQVARR